MYYKGLLISLVTQMYKDYSNNTISITQLYTVIIIIYQVAMDNLPV